MEATREQHDLRSPDRCPFCRDAITTAKPIVACAACGARHHEACHQDHGACAACAATDLLVPAAGSSARARREHPPKGSTITVDVEGEDGVVVYQWPRFRNPAAMWAIVICLAATVLLSPIALLILFDLAHNEPLQIRLEPKRLRLISAPSGALGRKEHLASRRDIGSVVLDRSTRDARLTIDIGVERVVVASSATLKEPELEWLHDALLAWKAEG